MRSEIKAEQGGRCQGRLAVNVQMVLEVVGSIIPAFGEGVQCAGAVVL